MTARLEGMWHREAVKYRMLLLTIREHHRPRRGFRQNICTVCNEPFPCFEVAAIDEALS